MDRFLISPRLLGGTLISYDDARDGDDVRDDDRDAHGGDGRDVHGDDDRDDGDDHGARGDDGRDDDRDARGGDDRDDRDDGDEVQALGLELQILETIPFQCKREQTLR